MKVQNQKSIRSRQGFTLVEMLGVLAIIAILISVIAVGVLSAINRARVVATVSNLKNIETAVTGYVALGNSGGTLPLTEGTGAGATNGVPVIVSNNVTYVANGVPYIVDQVLVSSGLIEKSLGWRVGTDGTTSITAANEPRFLVSKRAYAAAGSNVWTDYNRVECAPVNSAIAAIADLDADALASTAFLTAPQFFIDGQSPINAGRVAFVVLKNVSLKDAVKLSQELNGALDDTESFVASADSLQARGRLVFSAPASATTVDCYYYIASF